MLITNTFQASSYALKHDQIAPSVAEVNRGAVDDARQAHPQLLLGSMGPIGIEWFAEDSAEYREIRGIAREQAHALLNAGVDGLLIETVTSIRNLQPMLAGARDAADGMPVLVSFVVADKGDLLGDGLNIEAAVLYAERGGAQDGCIGDYSRHGASQRRRSGPDSGWPRMAREPRSFRARMHRMETCRCRNGGQLLWNHGNHYGRDGRGARYIKGKPLHTGRFFYCLHVLGSICPNGECWCRQVAECMLRVYPMRTMIQTL